MPFIKKLYRWSNCVHVGFCNGFLNISCFLAIFIIVSLLFKMLSPKSSYKNTALNKILAQLLLSIQLMTKKYSNLINLQNLPDLNNAPLTHGQKLLTPVLTHQ